MIVTDLLGMVTVMESSAHNTAIGFPEIRDCLGCQVANGTNGTMNLKL